MKLNFLAPWKQSNDKPRQLTKNQRHHLVDKSHISKLWVFPVVMYGCESSTIKKAEHRRIDTFKCGAGEDSWESHGQKRKSVLKETNPEYSLEGPVLKLKLQYFGHLMWRADSPKKTLMLGKIKDRKRTGQQKMRWLGSVTDSKDTSLSGLWETVKDREAWHAAVHGDAKSWTWLSNWTTNRDKMDINNYGFPTILSL